jgi:RNA polymerase sigma-70 factor (ECF subfamily)
MTPARAGGTLVDTYERESSGCESIREHGPRQPQTNVHPTRTRTLQPLESSTTNSAPLGGSSQRQRALAQLCRAWNPHCSRPRSPHLSRRVILSALPRGILVAPVRDDEQLLAQMVSGSCEAFEELYSRYHHEAYRMAWLVCRGHEASEEAVQDAFAAVWRGRAGYEPARGMVAPWLFSLVRYRAIDVARENRKHASRRAAQACVDLWSSNGNVAEALIARDDAAALRSRLTGLPELQREVIVLAYYGELSHSEIATKLGLSAGTVKGRMRLGISKLRRASAVNWHAGR